jgi:hypothetical protein
LFLLLLIALPYQAIAGTYNCGQPPPPSFSKDKEYSGSLKGKIETKLGSLSKFFGDPKLGAEIDAAKAISAKELPLLVRSSGADENIPLG